MCRGEVHAEFSVEKPEGKRPLGRPRHGLEVDINKGILRKWPGRAGRMWLRAGTSGWLL